MTLKKFTLAALLYTQTAQATLCLGYSKIFGETGPQFTDDGLKALRIMEMMEDYPNFDFHFDIYSDFVYDKKVNIDEKPLVDSTSIKMRLNNWADFVVYLGGWGYDLSKLQPNDFEGLTHGDKDY